MNDRLDSHSTGGDKITVDKQLLQNFTETVKTDRSEFLLSFKILLEQLGLPISDEEKFKSFWRKVELRAKEHNHKTMGLSSLHQMDKDTRLYDEIHELVQEYYEIFCSDVETRPSSIITKLMKSFGDKEGLASE